MSEYAGQGEYRLIPIGQISANKNQPRKTFSQESLSELADSIRAVGVIQPLTVRETSPGRYVIVSGERRWRASAIAGLGALPCMVVSAGEREAEIMSLVENIQREDLNFVEEARAYVRLMESLSCSQQELAGMLGKQQSTVSNKLRILRLGDEVLGLLLENSLTERHARALLAVPDPKARISAVRSIARRGLNVRQTEELVEKLRSGAVLNPAGHRNIKNVFNYKIYTNTIKQAYDYIRKTGIAVDYAETQFDDRVEVKIVIPIEKTEG